MQSKAQRIKTLDEIVQATREGEVIINGKENPTDLQISQAIRTYARQFGNIAKIQDDERFLLKNAHPMVSAKKGTIKSKKEWMDEYDWNEDKFMSLKETAVLVRR